MLSLNFLAVTGSPNGKIKHTYQKHTLKLHTFLKFNRVENWKLNFFSQRQYQIFCQIPSGV